MTKSLTYETAVEILLDRVPEFRDKGWDRENADLPMVVFGNLASFLNERLLTLPQSNPTVQASFALLNEMGNSTDQRVVNLATVGTFEVLTDSQPSIRAARQLLYGRALDWFEEMIRTWGVEVKDP